MLTIVANSWRHWRLGFCAAVAFFVAMAGASAAGNLASTVTLIWLRDAVSNDARIPQLKDKRVVVEGLVHGYAEGSIFLDLRPAAQSLLGTDEENPGDECVGLVVPRKLFTVAKGHHVLRVHGTIFLVQKVAAFSTSREYRGIRFYPECGYDRSQYPYIFVSRLEPVE